MVGSDISTPSESLQGRLPISAGWLCGAALLFLVAACGGQEPSSLEDCAEVSDPQRRDECYAEFLPERFRTDPEGAASMVEERIADPAVRDFVYLAVTRRVDPSTDRWCERIQEPALDQRCRVIVSRPHLHRELVKTPPGKPAPPTGAVPPPEDMPGSPADR